MEHFHASQYVICHLAWVCVAHFYGNIIKVKGKVHKAMVRPAMAYGLEAAPLEKSEEKKMDVAEMIILSWMIGVTRRDRNRNE